MKCNRYDVKHRPYHTLFLTTLASIPITIRTIAHDLLKVGLTDKRLTLID